MNLKYDWNSDIAPHLDTMTDVEGGFTPARRGIVTLESGDKVFVKIATSDMTEKWLRKELKVYERLNAAGYPYAPELLAQTSGTDQTGMAITYLDSASFEHTWDADKLNAVVAAQDALKQYKDLFVGDADFRSDDIVSHTSKWPTILQAGNVAIINTKLEKLGAGVQVDQTQLEQYAADQAGWTLREDSLVHEDIRADNFGYDPATKTGKLIDWNWLCIGDTSLDSTGLFVNIYQSGFDPYQIHPEKYDPQVLKYILSYWVVAVMEGSEDSNEREWKLRAAQARGAATCLELLGKK